MLREYPTIGLADGEKVDLVGVQIESLPPIEIKTAKVIHEYPNYVLLETDHGIKVGVNKGNILGGDQKIIRRVAND